MGICCELKVFCVVNFWFHFSLPIVCCAIIYLTHGTKKTVTTIHSLSPLHAQPSTEFHERFLTPISAIFCDNPPVCSHRKKKWKTFLFSIIFLHRKKWCVRGEVSCCYFNSAHITYEMETYWAGERGKWCTKQNFSICFDFIDGPSGALQDGKLAGQFKGWSKLLAMIDSKLLYLRDVIQSHDGFIRIRLVLDGVELQHRESHFNLI